jgi:hypothetical protein
MTLEETKKHSGVISRISAVFGVVNLLEAYGQYNPGANGQSG